MSSGPSTPYDPPGRSTPATERPSQPILAWAGTIIGALLVGAGEILRESGRGPTWAQWTLLIVGVILISTAVVVPALRGLHGVGKHRRSGH